jgi:hypothetical protein
MARFATYDVTTLKTIHYNAGAVAVTSKVVGLAPERIIISIKN